jgi:hypothetical protein
MAQVLLDAQILLASLTGSTALDLAPFTGEFDWDIDVTMKEYKRFDSLGRRTVLPANVGGTIGTKGQADYASGGVSLALNASHAREAFTEAVILGGVNAVAGDPALFTRGLLQMWKSPTGNEGDVAGYEMGLGVDNAPLDGYLLAPLANKSGGFTGTAVQVGAVPAGRRLWAALFVTAAAGTNLAVTIQSDNAVGFPSPATAITFSTVSATGGQFTSVAGPLTDDYFRVSETIGSGNFTWACVIGIS